MVGHLQVKYVVGHVDNYNNYSVIVHRVLHPCATSQRVLVAGIVWKAA